MNENNYEIKLLVECEICKRLIDKDDSRAVLESTYVCDPDLYPECLWEYNNRNYVRSEFYD